MGKRGELRANRGKTLQQVSAMKSGESPPFQGVTTPPYFGLWLQWSWVQIPSLTLPSQENPNRFKLLSARPVGGSCTLTLRRMFRDLSRPVCVVPIRRFSALDPCFPPASQPPRRSLRARPRLHSLRSNRDRCFTGPRRWPREPPNQSPLWARPHGLGPSRRPRRCAQPPPSFWGRFLKNDGSTSSQS